MTELKEIIENLRGKEQARRLKADEEERTDVFLQEVLGSLPTSYPQDWPAYNAAQVEEKLLFLDILAELCALVDDKREHGKTGGRPWLALGEMAFCCVSKVYEQLSSRRASSDLELARRRGYLSHVPHFNSVLNYFNEEELTPILHKLIEVSALPLKDFETTFAMDASGLSSAFYSRWLDYRFNEDRRYHDWMKIHVVIGIKTQIVTAIRVTDAHSADSPQFPALFHQTAKNFNRLWPPTRAIRAGQTCSWHGMPAPSHLYRSGIRLLERVEVQAPGARCGSNMNYTSSVSLSTTISVASWKPHFQP